LKTIAWDVDDVLNNLMKVWLEQFWQPKNVGHSPNYEEIKVNPPYQLLGVNREEYLASLDEFRLSGRYDQMKPLKEVNDWFLENGAKFKHVAITMVPIAASHISAAWVIKNFGKWIRSFHFIPSYRVGEKLLIYDENKGTYLHYFGKADLLIDDTLENIEATEKYGIKTLTFPRPWNNAKQTIKQTLDEILVIMEG